MAGGTIGTAYVGIVPTTTGIQSAINDAIANINPNTTGISNSINGAVTNGSATGGAAGSAAFSQKFKGGLNAASLGIAAVIGVGVAAGVASLKALYDVGKNFDKISDTIRIGTGATGANLDSLVASSKIIAAVVPASFTDISTTVADLNTRLGLTGPTLEKVAEQFLEAGRISGTALDTNAITGGLSAFGIEGEAVTGALDKMFQTSQATGVSMNDLANGAAAAAPSMKNLGFSFYDSIAMIGSFDKAGIDSGAVMKSMQKGLIALAKDGEEPQSAFKRVTSEIDAMVKAGDTTGAINKASGIFGTKGAVGFVNALQSGKVNLNDLQSSLGATSDSILGVGTETMDAAEKWTIFKNKAMIAVEPLADKVFTGLGTILDKITPKVEELFVWFNNNVDAGAAIDSIGSAISVAIPKISEFFGWMEKNKETIITVAKWVGGIAIGILALNAALTVYTIVMGTVAAITQIWTGVQWLLNASLLANPITWIVIGVIALIAVVVLLVKNWDAVSSAVSGFISSSGEIISGYASAISGWFSGIWNSITSGVSSVFNFIGDKISSAVSSITSGLTSAGTGIMNFFKMAVNFIVGILNTPIVLLNNLIKGINNIKISVPSWVPGIGGKSFGGMNIPTLPIIPMLATGGDVLSATTLVAGEKQPETIVNRGVANNLMEILTNRLNDMGDISQQKVIVEVSAKPGFADTLTYAVANTSSWKQKR